MKDFKGVLSIMLCTVMFVSGAIAGGLYVLNNLKIEETATSYNINFEGHIFEYEK